MDFNIKTYQKLLESLITQGYSFQTFSDYLEKQGSKSVILRHDVEAKYGNALAFARIQSEFHIKGTYYFRFLPNHFSTDIIREISSLGHEIGYHYDDLSHCKGDYDTAIKRFEKNLATLREIAEVKTICMEGAPLSKWDNRDLWRRGDGEKGRSSTADRRSLTAHRSPLTVHYRDYGIIGEPYFDLDFSKVLYLTDTGRRWDGGKFSVRDKVGSWQSAVSSRQFKFQNPNSKFQTNSKSQILNSKQTQNSKLKTQNFSFHSTSEIIKAANLGQLPDQIMMTFHPQRWTDKPLPWLQELVLQNVKNVVKRMVVSVNYYLFLHDI